jgi:hypothetical protein
MEASLSSTLVRVCLSSESGTDQSDPSIVREIGKLTVSYRSQWQHFPTTSIAVYKRLSVLELGRTSCYEVLLGHATTLHRVRTHGGECW